MLGAEPASVIGELFGVNNGTQQPAYFPQWRPMWGSETALRLQPLVAAKMKFTKVVAEVIVVK